MNIHKNARLTPVRREEMALAVVAGQLTRAQAARVYGVSSKIVSRWAGRYKTGGANAMTDRSSRPKTIPRQTDQTLAERIIALRRQRLTGRHIAMETGVSPATVSRVLKRAGLSRIKDLAPAEPVIRYEYAEPGGLIHLDIKRLGRFERVGHRITGDRTGQSNSRGVGWEYVHVCIDDASRIAFTDIFKDEKAVSATAFLKAAVAYYNALGITVTRVMSDNGSCYKARDFAKACKALGLKHIRTKPYTPKTNGKAERFIQTALREWAYARAYQTSEQRKHHLPNWTHMYNWHRPHGSLNSKPPISRLGLTGDNLLRLHI
jgi:transposase InsO family protein